MLSFFYEKAKFNENLDKIELKITFFINFLYRKFIKFKR